MATRAGDFFFRLTPPPTNMYLYERHLRRMISQHIGIEREQKFHIV